MMPGFFRSRLAVSPLLAVAGVALALAGCADSTRVASCPGAAILADAAVRPVLKAGAAATDPSSVLYTVRALTIDTGCNLNRRLGEADSVVTVTFRATRAPTGQAARYVVPYFLVINQGARIINKRVFNLTVDFAPGSSAVTMQATVPDTLLRLENGRLPSDYQFLAGLQISETEQAYLKTAGAYTP